MYRNYSVLYRSIAYPIKRFHYMLIWVYTDVNNLNFPEYRVLKLLESAATLLPFIVQFNWFYRILVIRCFS